MGTSFCYCVRNSKAIISLLKMLSWTSGSRRSIRRRAEDRIWKMARCLDPTLKSVGASYEQCCRSGFRLTGYEYEIQNRPSINLLRKTEGKKIVEKGKKEKNNFNRSTGRYWKQCLIYWDFEIGI